MERVVLEISWASLWRIFFFFLLVVIMFLGRQILLGLFLAIVISSGLEFVVDFMEEKGVPRTVGVLLVFLLSLLSMIVCIYSLVPRVLADLRALSPSLGGTGRAWLRPLGNLQSAKSFDEWLNRFSTQFLQSDSSPLALLSSIVGGVALAVSVFVSSFYLSLSHDGVERFIRAILPEDSEETALRVYARSRKKIGLWFRTQLLLSFIMAVLVWVALLILGVNDAFLVGILAGIFELVPFIGPILSGAVAVLAALTTSPDVSLALWTLIVFLFLHQLESHALVPLLTGRSVGLHPVIVIIALLIGAEAGGLLGIIIAVPAAAVIQEILEDWGARKRNYA